MNTLLVKKSVWLGALALGMFASATFAGGKGIKVGDSFPELGSLGLEGNLPGDLKGKVVLVDFWASWCGPCKESFPIMQDLHHKYAEQGLVILAVNVDEDKAAMKDFLKDHPADFIILHDTARKLVSTANIASMPTSFLIGRDGKVVSIHKGCHGKATAAQYAREFDELLSAKIASK